MNSIEAPVLFMVFNRPSKTTQVWEEIRKAKPSKLYVSADGPRDGHPDDINKCKEVREIVTNVDWICEVKYLFHEKNLGCSLAGKTAFDWVFSKEDRLIELEDDTVPSLSFFKFMDLVLDRYKDKDEIGYVTGQNFMGIQSGDGSYFFSHYGGSSGWGTWKRVYEKWDYRLERIANAYKEEFKKNFDSQFEYNYWLRNFENYFKNGGNTYDLQSAFLVFERDFKNIIPNINLVTNIGFDQEGTNYSGGEELFGNKERFEINEIIHPSELKRNVEIDKKIFEYHFLRRSRLSYYFRWILGPLVRKIFPKKNNFKRCT
jgi:hypothetical protein